jgi:arylsulfatase A-like enzyme
MREMGALGALAPDLKQRYLEGEFEPRASVVKPEDYHDTFAAGLAVDFIREQPKDKPMCLVVSLHSPHPPLDAPGEFATMYDPQSLTLPANVPESFARDGRTIDRAEVRRMLANYLGKMALVDHCVGRLVEAMRARGTWDNALVIFTADHGEMMGSHGAMAKGRFYEESGRVPLVVRWPGRVRTGRTPALAQMMDVYPTIVDAIGGEVTPGRLAKSLLPVAEGKRASVRDLVIGEIGKAAPLDIMARDARFKYWADESDEYLFDIEKDPLEMHNLADAPEHRETLEQMRQKLLTHLRSTQVNFGEGYKGKVHRMREAEAKKSPR